MSKRIWSIALAYIGVMIGAGVSSLDRTSCSILSVLESGG